MIRHSDIRDDDLRDKIKRGELRFGGNRRLLIYGSLSCGSGKRMKKEHRVFFATELEAQTQGFRPCGHCLKERYKQWKNEFH